MGLQSSESVIKAAEHNARLLSADQQRLADKEMAISNFGTTLKEIYDLAIDWTLRSGHAEIDNGDGLVATLRRAEGENSDEETRIVVSVAREGQDEVSGLTLLGPDKFRFLGGTAYHHTPAEFELVKDSAPVKKMNLVAEAFGLK